MEGETRFTPGPWKVFRSTDGEQIIGIGREETGDGVTDPRFGLWCDGEERDANAKLIAAAPCLLEACQAALATHGLVESEKGLPALSDVEDMLRAAIAKATA